MKHDLVTPQPYCRLCGMSWYEIKETGSVCKGEIVHRMEAPSTAGAHHGPVAVAAPHLLIGTIQLLDMYRAHYDHACGQSPAAQRQRLMARNLCRLSGINPETIMIQGPLKVAGPRGAVAVEHVMAQSMPAWCLYWTDAERILAAVDAAQEGKELTSGSDRLEHGSVRDANGAGGDAPISGAMVSPATNGLDLRSDSGCAAQHGASGQSNVGRS